MTGITIKLYLREEDALLRIPDNIMLWLLSILMVYVDLYNFLSILMLFF